MSQNNSRQWYVQTDDGHSSGPFSDTDLHNMFQAGNIKIDTLVWCQELDAWQPMGDFPNTLRLHEKPEVVPTLGHYYVPAPPTVEQRVLRQEPQFQPKKVKKTATPVAKWRDEEVDVYASVWRRFIAYCIDVFILSIAAFIVNVILFTLQEKSILLNFKMTYYWVLLNVISLAYFAYFHAKYCASPGKLLMEVKLVSTKNKPISIINGVLHAALFALLNNFILIHLIIIPLTKRKQGLPDLLCGTVVLKHKMPGPNPNPATHSK